MKVFTRNLKLSKPVSLSFPPHNSDVGTFLGHASNLYLTPDIKGVAFKKDLLKLLSSLPVSTVVHVEGLFLFNKPYTDRRILLEVFNQLPQTLIIDNEPSYSQISTALKHRENLFKSLVLHKPVSIRSLADGSNKDLTSGASRMIAYKSYSEIMLSCNNIDPLYTALTHELFHIQLDLEGYPPVQSPFLEAEVDRRAAALDSDQRKRFLKSWVPMLLTPTVGLTSLIELHLSATEKLRNIIENFAANTPHVNNFESFLSSPFAFRDPMQPFTPPEIANANTLLLSLNSKNI